MKKSKNITQKLVLMIALVGLFLATNYHNFSAFQPQKEKTENCSKENNFTLQSVTFEATHSVATFEFFNDAAIIFSVAKAVFLQEYIAQNILSPNFTNRILQILFTRIIPTKAP